MVEEVRQIVGENGRLSVDVASARAAEQISTRPG